MRKLKVWITVLAMALLVASPALADTVTVQIGGVSAEGTSQFLGNDSATAEVGNFGVTAESQFLFFDNGVFN